MRGGLPVTIATVVEGHGEVAAVPILLRSIAASHDVPVAVPRPFRRPRSDIARPAGLARAVRLVASRVVAEGGTLVLLDADDDQPDELRQRLESTLEPSLGRVEVVVANREFEAWFLASIPSLRRHPSIRADAQFDGDPEGPRNAKKHLEAMMLESYKETRHQAGFAALVDIEAAAARSASFDRFARAVTSLLTG